MVHRVGPGQAVHPHRQGGYVVSEQLVLTPGGFRPKSFVNFIEPGFGLILDQRVMRKIDLATRRMIDLPAPPALQVTFGAFGPGRTPLAPPATGKAVPSAQPGALPDGWQTYAWWDSGASASITSFATTWTVPQAPGTDSGQVVFLFNGIQNTGQDFGILQPVLQWGVSAAGGGNFWSVASWYVTSGGQAFHTTLVPVDTGTVLVGRMTQTGSARGLFNYNSAFQGIPNTTLPILDIAAHHWASETLECYGISKCSDFPASSDTAMSGIDILTGTTHPNVVWTPVNHVTDCGQRTTIVSNANPGSEVDVWYRAQTGWHHNDLSSAASAPASAGNPAGYLFNAQGTQHVVCRGPDNHIHELWWDNDGWHHNDLSSATSAPDAAGDPTGYMFDASGTQHVVYRGADNHIHELWWDNDGWHHNDLSSATSAPDAAGDPAGYMFDAQGTQHVVYRAADNHIHELWWDNDGWHHNDLSDAASAPDAAGDPAGYMFDAQGTQHVVYRAADNHIHELWWDNDGWHHNDLSDATSAPDAAGDPAGYMFDAQATQHVVYRGADNHIHELWWDNDGWHHNDLSSATSARDAAGNPAGYMFNASGTQHVVYRGTDNHIHELWWDSNGWHHDDLSVAAPAPDAAGDPAGYMFNALGTQHVVYRGTDNHIHELWWD
jgi:Fungal fucose-specific lectin